MLPNDYLYSAVEKSFKAFFDNSHIIGPQYTSSWPGFQVFFFLTPKGEQGIAELMQKQFWNILLVK